MIRHFILTISFSSLFWHLAISSFGTSIAKLNLKFIAGVAVPIPIQERIVSLFKYIYDCTTIWLTIWVHQFLLMISLVAAWTYLVAVVVSFQRNYHQPLDDQMFSWIYWTGVLASFLVGGLFGIWQGHQWWCKAVTLMIGLITLVTYLNTNSTQLIDVTMLLVAIYGSAIAATGSAFSTTAYLTIKSWWSWRK